MTNDELIKEYLDIAANDSENFDRFSKLLSDDCVWYITPPGIAFEGRENVKAFSKMAFGARTHDAKHKVEIRNWFRDGDNFCVEYFHGAIVTIFRIKVTENVCLVCHIREGKFDRIHEYVDTSRSWLIRFGLSLLPLLVKINSPSGTRLAQL